MTLESTTTTTTHSIGVRWGRRRGWCGWLAWFIGLPSDCHADRSGSIKSPTESLMRMLYSRKVDKEDLLTISILHFWSISGSTEIKVADITLTLIKANLKLLDKHHEKEKKRRKEEFPLPPLKNILKFLDLLRVKCKNIISDKVNKDHLHHPLLQNNSIQQALQLVNNKAPESLKEEFAELLALAEDVMEEESRGAAPGQGRNLRNLSVRKSAKAEKRMNEKRSSSNNSGSDSNSEDDFVDFNHKKKKKASRMDFD